MLHQKNKETAGVTREEQEGEDVKMAGWKKRRRHNSCLVVKVLERNVSNCTEKKIVEEVDNKE